MTEMRATPFSRNEIVRADRRHLQLRPGGQARW